MIEWKKWDGNILTKRKYLIHTNGDVKSATPYLYKPGSENMISAWALDDHTLTFNVSHYAEINFPEAHNDGRKEEIPAQVR
jgi:hypothetical protein